MELEILKNLEKCSRLAYYIEITYTRLSLLEVSKNMISDYNKQKEDLINTLKSYIKAEDKAYEYFNDYQLVSTALELFYKRISFKVSNRLLLVQKRIIKKLEAKVLETGLEEKPENFFESYLEIPFYTHLVYDEGYDFDDLEPIIRTMPIVNDAMSRRFIKNLNHQLYNCPDYEIYSKNLINIKFDFIYENSGDLEKDAINNNFDSITLSNIQDKKDSHISVDALNKIISSYVLEFITDTIVVCGSSTELDMVLDDMLWFKTYLYFLDDEDFIKIKIKVSDYPFQKKTIKTVLLGHLDRIEKIRCNNNGLQK